MIRRMVAGLAAVAAVVALAAAPAPAGSHVAAPARTVDAAAFRPVALAQAVPVGTPLAEARSEGYLDGGGRFLEPGTNPDAGAAVASRPRVDQPEAAAGTAWKPARYTLSGYASFYDHGTTAMRLPRGTVVRICGGGGCILRTIDDYGPQASTGRIVDLYRPDFFAVCGCAWFSGTTRVTISVY